MVDPLTAGAAVVSGFKLVKQSVDFIKQNISTAKDIGDLIGHIDKAMAGEQQAIGLQQAEMGLQQALQQQEMQEQQTSQANQALVEQAGQLASAPMMDPSKQQPPEQQ